MTKICLPIYEKSIHDVISFVEKTKEIESNGVSAYDITDVFEIRLDYLNNTNYNFALEIFDDYIKKPKIATNRKPSEGGVNKNIDEGERHCSLLYATEVGYDYVDVEESNSAEFIDYIIRNKDKSKIILSKHDFKRTPNNLKDMANKFYENFKPDILKFATQYKKKEDVSNMQELIKNPPIDLIGIVMGKKGQPTRLNNMNYLNFFSIDKKPKFGQVNIFEAYESLKR